MMMMTTPGTIGRERREISRRNIMLSLLTGLRYLCKEVIIIFLIFFYWMRHRYHTVFLPSDVFRRILSQMRKNKKTEDRDGQFVY